MPQHDMLINYVPGEECRIAIVADGRLEEFYQERASSESHVGSIYKGRVSNVEPSIQAAFVDFGLERNGFLHISDLHPMYFPGDHKEEVETVGLKTPRRERPPMQKCLRRGQEILVQVLKEGIGTKGPTLTSYLSIPGRYLVMMPYMERLGVSRKIEDDDARRESRKILQELNPPEGFGFIIRTAGIGQSKTELKRDLAYLVRLWKTLEKRMNSVGQIGELYTESDLLIRTLRDVFTSDIGRIIIDDVGAAHRAHDFLSVVSPRSGSHVYLYKEPIPLFHRFDIERQIETIHARTVPLPSGGSLVIDQAEAMVAIDVNSGKSRDNRDAETTAYKTDLEACDEVCRQLKLRDLGGVVVIDMIDMHQAKHRRDVETRFRNNLKKDRARTQVLPISRFGILEMTRQRMRPSLTKSSFTPCPHCQGEGQVKTPETVVLEVSRRLALAMQRSEVARIDLTVSPDVAFQLLNRKRAQLVAMEQRFGKPVMVRVSGGGVDLIDIACFDARGGSVVVDTNGKLNPPELEQIVGGVDLLAEIEAEEQAQVEAAAQAEAEAKAAAQIAYQTHEQADAEGESSDQVDGRNGYASVQTSGGTHGDDDITIAPPTRPQGSMRVGGQQSQVRPGNTGNQPPVTRGDETGAGEQRGRGRSRGRGRGRGRGREQNADQQHQGVESTQTKTINEQTVEQPGDAGLFASPADESHTVEPTTIAEQGAAMVTPSIISSADSPPAVGTGETTSASLPSVSVTMTVAPSSVAPATITTPGSNAPKPIAGGWRRKRGTQGGLLYPRVQPGNRGHTSTLHTKPGGPASTSTIAVVGSASVIKPVNTTNAGNLPPRAVTTAMPPMKVGASGVTLSARPVNRAVQPLPASTVSHAQPPANVQRLPNQPPRPPAQPARSSAGSANQPMNQPVNQQRMQGNQSRTQDSQPRTQGNPPRTQGQPSQRPHQPRQNQQRQNQQRPNPNQSSTRPPQPSRNPAPQRSNQPQTQPLSRNNATSSGNPGANPSRGYKNAVVAKPDNTSPQ